jgi:hypothetical protein
MPERVAVTVCMRVDSTVFVDLPTLDPAPARATLPVVPAVAPAFTPDLVMVWVFVNVRVLVYLYVVVTTEADGPVPWVYVIVLLPIDVVRERPMLSLALEVATGFAVATGIIFPAEFGVKYTRTVLVVVRTIVVGMTLVLVPLTRNRVVSSVWVDVASWICETVATIVVETLKLELELEELTPAKPFPMIEALLIPVPRGAVPRGAVPRGAFPGSPLPTGVGLGYPNVPFNERLIFNGASWAATKPASKRSGRVENCMVK